MPANQPVNHHGSPTRETPGLSSKGSEMNSATKSDVARASPPGDGNQAASGTERQQLASYEFVDCRELARRWDVPVSWIRDQVRRRAEDPLPHVSLGKYVRFLWGSPELQAWIERRIVIGNNRRVGRVH